LYGAFVENSVEMPSSNFKEKNHESTTAKHKGRVTSSPIINPALVIGGDDAGGVWVDGTVLSK
jgi:hypothetical protein